MRIHYKTRYIHPGINSFDKDLGFKFRPNSNFIFGSKIAHFNKFGYLGKDWKTKKNDSTYRIAIVGTCTVSGIFHIIDSCNYNFPELSENELRKRGCNVEILNFGISGENRSYYIFKSIFTDVIRFNSDLILLEWELPFRCGNYVYDWYNGYEIEYLKDYPDTKDLAIKWVNKLNKFKILTSIYSNCYFLKAIGRNYQYTHDSEFSKTLEFIDKKQVCIVDDAFQWYYTMDKSLKMSSELKENLDKKGTNFYFFLYGKDIKVSNICNKNHLPLLELDCNFNHNMFYKNDSHLNNLGQLEITKHFINSIINIIPTKYKQNSK